MPLETDAFLQAVRSSPDNGNATPGNGVTSPEHEDAIPVNGDATRGNGGVIPVNEGAISENEGTSPENVDGVHEYGDATRESGGTSTETPGAISESGGTIPGNGGASPADGDTNGDGREGRGEDRGGSIWDSLIDQESVMKKSNFRFAAIELGSVGDDPKSENPSEREEDCDGSLFTLTVLSGKETAISWAKNYTLQKVTKVTDQLPCYRTDTNLVSNRAPCSHPSEAPAHSSDMVERHRAMGVVLSLVYVSLWLAMLENPRQSSAGRRAR